MNFDEAKKEIIEILNKVDEIKPPIAKPIPDTEKLWYNDEDGCSMRMSYAAPLRQSYSFNCSSYSVRQVVYSLLGLDLSGSGLADYALSQGWMNHEGAGHSELASILNYTSNGRLKIDWFNFSYVGFNGLDELCK